MELVVFVALLVGGAVATWYLAGIATSQTFDDLAARLAAGADAAGRPSSHGTAPGPSGSVAGSRPVHASQALWVAAWVALLGVAYMGWRVIRGRRYPGHRGGGDRRVADVCTEEGIFQAVSADQQDRLFSKRQQILRILSGQPMDLFRNRVEVRQLMTRNPLTVRPQTSVEELRETVANRRVRHILVCDGHCRLLGIVSDRDLSLRRGKTAGDVMTPDPITVSPRTAVGPAITLLLSEHISCVPVVEDGAPCGVLTTTDLMMSLQCALQILTSLATELQQSAVDGRASATAS